MKSNFLPEEVVAEILFRLPIKFILTCTCVCKSWYSLIKSSYFISTHLQNSSNRYFLYRTTKQYSDSYYLRSYNETFKSYMPLQTYFDPMDNFVIYAGSCNGLICRYEFQKQGYKVYLWNPLIKKSLSIDSISKIAWNTLYDAFLGFGFDSRSNDYKVLSVLIGESDFRVELYSLNLNSWKDITHITHKFRIGTSRFGFENADSIFVNGALHWIVTHWENKDKHLIKVFDMRDEVFREIWLPERVEGSPSLGVNSYEESSITVIYSNNFEHHIWVMKEYGVESSWMKLATVGNLWSVSSTMEVLGLRNNGEALIAIYHHRLRYTYYKRDGCLIIASNKLNSQQNEILMDLKDDVAGFHVYSFVGSLVLLDKGHEGDVGDAKHATDVLF